MKIRNWRIGFSVRCASKSIRSVGCAGNWILDGYQMILGTYAVRSAPSMSRNLRQNKPVSGIRITSCLNTATKPVSVTKPNSADGGFGEARPIVLPLRRVNSPSRFAGFGVQLLNREHSSLVWTTLGRHCLPRETGADATDRGSGWCLRCRHSGAVKEPSLRLCIITLCIFVGHSSHSGQKLVIAFGQEIVINAVSSRSVKGTVTTSGTQSTTNRSNILKED